MLLGAAYLTRYIANYRVCWLAGRYGGGKTALAFRLAYEFMRGGDYRYLLTNVKSAWSDDPATCTLRDGKYLDAVIILDEAGEFMASRSDARKWLVYLRKLNVILLMPSVLPPSSDVRFLSIRRLWNGQSLGLPYWMYRVRLESGDISEKLLLNWFFPSEIYGIYDTDGYPSDADEILEHIKTYIAQAAKTLGYEATASRQQYAGRRTVFSTGDDEQISKLAEDLAGEADNLREVSKQAERSLSLLAKRAKK